MPATDEPDRRHSSERRQGGDRRQDSVQVTLERLESKVDAGFRVVNGRLNELETDHKIDVAIAVERARVAKDAVTAGLSQRQFWIGAAGVIVAIVGSRPLL